MRNANRSSWGFVVYKIDIVSLWLDFGYRKMENETLGNKKKNVNAAEIQTFDFEKLYCISIFLILHKMQVLFG